MGLSNVQTYMMLVAMILSGASNTIVYNLQNSQYVYLSKGGEPHYYKFDHPFMQGVTMFLGEFLTIILFIYQKSSDKHAYNKLVAEAEAKGLSNKYTKYFWLAVPSMCDFFTSSLQYVALTKLAPSIYQMMRGGVVLVTAFLSWSVLKRKIYSFNLLGCGLVFGGICLVGAANFIFPEDPNGGGTDDAGQMVGIILILISLLFNGGLFVSEEKLFGVYNLQPFEVVGTEGFFGLIYYCITLPILCTSKCTFTSGCVEYPVGTEPHFDSVSLFFAQFGHNAFLACMIIMGILTIAVFNVCGVTVTKYISALARSIADVSRTLLVWIASLIITFTAGKSYQVWVNKPNLPAIYDKPYAWENTNPKAIGLEAAGFVVLVTGNLIYNKIIVLPFKAFQPPQETVIEIDSTENLIDPQQKDISLQPNDYENAFGDNYVKRSSSRDSFHN